MSRRKSQRSRSERRAGREAETTPDTPIRERRETGRAVAYLAALVVAVLLAYQPAWHGGELWDDDGHITKPELVSADGLHRIWFEIGATQQYYPVVHSTFWLFHQLWGRDTLGYHLVNIGLHALSGFLLTLLLRRLAVPGAVLAGILFALHPVHVESVAWITELKNTLSGVLYLAAALAYLRFDSSRRRAFYAVALALFLLALLAKSVTATLPAALLVVFWWKRGRVDWRRDVLPLVPFFATGILFGLFTAWVERTYIGAHGGEFNFSFVERALIAGRAAWFYVTTLVWPANLQFIYPRWNVSARVWRQYFFPAGVAVALAVAWRFRTSTRTPLTVLLLFVGTLFPALGFVNVFPFRYSFVADHFQYLASMPMLAAIASGLTTLGRRLFAAKPHVMGAGVVLIALGLGALTWRQSHLYVDAETLYRETIARNPGAWMAYNNLGSLKLLGSTDRSAKAAATEAAALVQEAIRLFPDNPEAHNNLGVAYQRMGRLADAEKEHREAIRLLPSYAEPYNNLGIVAEQQGRLDEAVGYYTTALRLQPREGNRAEVHYSLGSALRKLGRIDEAVKQYREATRVKPGFAEAHNNLGTVLVSAGRLDEAIAEFSETIRLKPDAALPHVNMADALRRLNRRDEAIASLRTAIALQPDLAFAHYSLGNLLYETGQLEAAVRAYQEALRYEPETSAHGIYNDLGVALALSGRRQEAIAAFDRALAIKPDFVDARNNRAKVK